MSLPSATSIGTSSLQRFSSSPTVAASAGDAQGYAAVAQQAGGESGAVTTHSVRGFRDLPGYGRIETLKVTETHIGADGKPVHTVKELAVCPECGTANCACLSRVTVQSRLDEENASGVRGQDKPDPFAMLPQPFNQLSANFTASAQGGSPPRMFG
jgi:hypothetical protein